MERPNGSITIVGLGPRGLSLLERLSAFSTEKNMNLSTIYLVDPVNPGCGVHTYDLPDHLLINTIVCQGTMYSDSTCQQAGPIVPGPTLFEWVQQQDYRWTSEGKIAQGKGRNIDPNDYVPRSLLGKYLNNGFTKFVDILKKKSEVKIFRTEVNEIKKFGNDIKVTLKDGTEFQTQYLFLTTGHTEHEVSDQDKEIYQQVENAKIRNPKVQYHAFAYPLNKHLRDVTQDHVVAIEGFGLTAADVIADLTVGRGGRFEEINENGDLKYIKSGKEPKKLLVYCRDGVPLSGRAVNQKGASGQHKAVYFTMKAVNDLKSKKKKLNFDQDVLPVILDEMQSVYYRKLFVQEMGLPESDFNNYLIKNRVSEPNWGEVASLFPQHHRFDFEKIAHPLSSMEFQNEKEFQIWLVNFLKEDLAEARKGNLTSPLKSACDILRDTRDTLRACIDFGSLEEESHRRFLTYYAPIFNRLAVGPPKERTAQALALMECGLMEANFGLLPKPGFDQEKGKFLIFSTRFKTQKVAEADVLIVSRIQPNLPMRDKTKLMQCLLHQGLVRPYFNGNHHPGGIEVNSDYKVIGADGQVSRNIWALGTIAEGAKYYTYILPRPGVNSTAINDAGRCILGLFAEIESASTNLSFKKAG